MFKALQQSIKVLKANPVRTVLTTLGIVIGIATVILVLSAGAGFRSLIDAQVQAFGTDTLFIETRVPPTTKNRASNNPTSADLSRASSSTAITTFKQKDLSDVEKLGNIKGAYGIVTGLAVASYRDNAKSTIYYGSSYKRFEIDKNTLKSGRFYTQAEDMGASQVVILGYNIANDLFGQDEALGKLIKIGNLNFQVIGVYDQQGSFGGAGADDILYIPMQTAQKKLLGIDYLLVGIVQLEDSNLGDSTAEQIKTLLRKNHNITDPAKDDFTVTTQAQAMDTFNTIFNGITILLICIASISLVVGGVGIMNIMYVVVTERTSEIGLKKALGATNKDILIEFLVESVLVTIIGGILGIILGAFGGWIISLIATASGLDWVFSVPFYSILLGVGVSATIGIGFGVLPARSASKLDPIEALRYE
jgi:putative ABC transport system permease protein